VKELFLKGKPLPEYLKLGEEGIQRKVDRLYERAKEIELPPGEIKYKKGLLFTEFWCPDCLVLAAALKYIQETFPDLEIRVLGRDNHLEILSHYSADGKPRIPFFVVLDKENKENSYLSEVPSSLQDIVKEDIGHRDYRAGKYMRPLIDDLWNLLS